MVAVFQEVRRVLRKDGTCWINIGDSYHNGDKGGHERPTTGKQLTNKGTVKGLTVNRRWQAGLKPKDLCGIPWRLAFALQTDGWWLRQDIIWHKPNPMPESVTDRCTKAHEYIFLLSKSERYHYDAHAIAEPCTAGDNGSSYTSDYDRQTKPGLGQGNRKARTAGNKTHKFVTEYEQSDSEEHRTKAGLLKISDEIYDKRNKRSVWTVSTQAYPEAHFATFPEELIVPCILAGCPLGGTVLDIFNGSGTTGVVALRYHRNYIGIELKAEFVGMSDRRISGDAPLFNKGEVFSSETEGELA